jgi:hypothetical protein
MVLNQNQIDWVLNKNIQFTEVSPNNPAQGFKSDVKVEKMLVFFSTNGWTPWPNLRAITLLLIIILERKTIYQSYRTFFIDFINLLKVLNLDILMLFQ